MGLLLFLTGCLALLSGVLKTRERIRQLIGSSWLAYAEIGSGTLVVFGSAVGLARQRVAAWGVVGVTLAVIVLSTSAQVRRARRARAIRRRSEADRLKSFLDSHATESHA